MLAPGQAWLYGISGKAYVTSECYEYRVISSSPVGDDRDATIEFAGIGKKKAVTITPQQNAGAPLRTTCVSTVEGGSGYDFSVANLSAVGGPSVSVYGDSVRQEPYVASSLGSTDCQNVSGEVSQYTLAQARGFAAAYQHGLPDLIKPLIQCGPAVGGFVTDYALQIKDSHTIEDAQYTYVAGSPQRYYILHTTCDLTAIDSTSAAVICAAVPSDNMPAQEFNLFYQ
jgi:hypothetical protein